MKTVILNTFTSFATFPMFNPAYLKGLLLRAGIENKHIDVNQITWNILLNEDFLNSLSFNKEIVETSPFPYSILNTASEFSTSKQKVLRRINKAKQILQSSSATNIRLLNWAQHVIFRALNLIYCHYGTFFMTNIPFWANIGFEYNDISHIYSLAEDRAHNPLIQIFELEIVPRIKQEAPDVILVDVMFPWDIIPALTLNILIKKHLPSCHINYSGLGFDEFSFSRITHKMKNPQFFFNFDSVFVYRNDGGIIELIKRIADNRKTDDIENLYTPKSFGPISTGKLFDESVIPNYDDIEWDKYFFPERIVVDRLSYRCFWAKCNFCSINSNKRTRQASHVDTQVNKIKTLHQKYQISNFWFLDEACPPEFAVEFADKIAKENITWSLRTRLDKKLNNENLARLSSAGLRELWIGLEHVDEEILSRMNKSDFNSDYASVAADVINNATKNNIGLHFCHILGFPSENDKNREKISEFYTAHKEGISRKPFFTTFNVFGLMLDSPMYEKPDQFGIIETHDDDTKFNMIQVPYKTIYDDDTSNPLVINNLFQWIGLYTSILVNQESLIPLWMSIADTPFEFLLKKYYNHNPFLKS